MATTTPRPASLARTAIRRHYPRQEPSAVVLHAGIRAGGSASRLGEALSLPRQRTEGWAAGLRLAAISLAHHPDPERFVTEFSGSERTVAGYLLAEVLERQQAEVRELLLRTAVLERVSGPVADYPHRRLGFGANLAGA
jgi:hypothetical protein